MKSKYFENSLAILGALLVIFGVSAAASDALAGNFDSLEIHGTATIY